MKSLLEYVEIGTICTDHTDEKKMWTENGWVVVKNPHTYLYEATESQILDEIKSRGLTVMVSK